MIAQQILQSAVGGIGVGRGSFPAGVIGLEVASESSHLAGPNKLGIPVARSALPGDYTRGKLKPV